MAKIIEFIKSKIGDKEFFGTITLKFEAGKVVHILETRSYKPE